MEVIATAEETGSITAAHPGAAMVLFAEDRTRPIRMTTDLPQRWTAPGAGAVVSGNAQRGEFYAFQVGVLALAPLDSVTVRFGDLRMGDSVIPAGAFSSFNTGGVDWQGRAFKRRVQVRASRVQSLWCGVLIPEGAAPGAYEGAVTVAAAGTAPVSLPVRLTVLPEVIPRHGDNEPWRLSRLRWLDSRARLDTTLVAPYTAVTVHGNVMRVLGREVTLAPTGLPAQVTSAFTPEMTAIGTTSRPLLAAPVAFVARDSAGRELPFRGTAIRVTRSVPGAALWTATSQAGPLHMQVNGQLDFDGNIEYAIALPARRRSPC